MKRLVNGKEEDLPEIEVRISRLTDRLLVHTEEGVFTAVAVRQGDAILVSYKGRQYKVEKPTQRRAIADGAASGEMRAPIPGTVVAVHVKEGEEITAGTTVLVLEAMKTQQPFTAPFDARVAKLPVSTGASVSEGELLAFLLPLADTLERVSE